MTESEQYGSESGGYGQESVGGQGEEAGGGSGRESGGGYGQESGSDRLPADERGVRRRADVQRSRSAGAGAR